MTSFKPPRQQRRPWIKRPRPSAWRGWADSLSLEHPAEAWELLAHETRELNCTVCPGRRRLKCLEPVHRIARLLQSGLEERLAGERFPSSRESEALALRAREAWTRLAVGYLCVQRDLDDRERGTRNAAALLGLQAMGRLMLVCYQQYVSEPPGAWLAVHALRNGADRATPKTGAPASPVGDAGDPESAYKQLLVMAAAGPLRLRRDEQAPVYRVLAEWSRHVAIRPLHGAQPKAPPVIFRTGEDEAPRQYPLDSLPDAPGLRLIDPAPLASRARRRLEQIETGDTRPAVSGEPLAGETLRVLLASWTGTVTRQFPRSETSQTTRFAVGLERAWQALEGTDVSHLDCRLADRSSAGFQALVQDPPTGIVQVGELVAVREGSQWVVGVIRWLRQPEPSLLQAGVETIAREPRPVRLHVRDGAGGSSPALLLQGNRAAHQPPSLVTALLPFREHMRVRLEESGEMVMLGQLVESTGSINRFRIEPEPPAP